jgi:uncharacterized protein YbjT (DUF2867 family)
MKVVIIGGSGLIGSKLAGLLQGAGHSVVIASPSRGVNAQTGEGLAQALAGAQVVVDVSNSPSFEDQPVLDFFRESTRNLLAAGAAAGVQHHVALSVVGTDRMQASGYFRAKMVQEDLIRASSLPYTIVRATQFFEFMNAIAQAATDGDTVRTSSARLQPIAADDVALAVARVVAQAPVGGILEIAGPEAQGLDVLLKKVLAAQGDTREVIADPRAGYFGMSIDDRSLTPDADAWLGGTTLARWLAARPAGA